MQVKAIIFRKDRTNDMVVPTAKKNALDKAGFRHNECMYFFNPDRAQTTWVRKGGFLWRKYYTTFYYIEGNPIPLPVPDFQMVMEPELKDGKPVYDAKTGRPKMRQVFPKTVNLGVPGDELASIFNPWFYRVIAAMGAKTWEKIQFALIAITLALTAYIGWTIGHMPSAEEVAQAVIAAQQAAEQAAQNPPPVVYDPGA